MSKMYRNFYQVFLLVFFACSTFTEKSIITAQAVSSSTVESSSQELERIPLPDENCPKEDVPCQEDIVSLDAIKTLHKQIDDDESGNIDKNESKEFFRDELQNTDGFERQSIFHGHDDKISVADLWNAWKRSHVYNWTVEDVVEWLIWSVDLPQYAQLFRDKHINGSYLPRVAVNTHHYISKDLGIKNPVHKHKLSIKAMDVVLFGPTKRAHNVLKDIVLVTSILVALGGCVFAYRQNKTSKEQLKKMMGDLDQLQKAEESLLEMNEKLQKAEEVQNEVVREKTDIEKKYKEEIETAKEVAERLKKERQDSNLEEMSRLQLAEEELIQVRQALRQAEIELESRWSYGAPAELQQWLQYTFELENAHFTAKQQAAQRQFGSAKDACEKIRKKRTGVLGTWRIAQGNSIDDIDQRIVQARMALEEIKHDMQERQQRWQSIESFCGFPIRTNPGMAKLENALYGDGGSGSGRLASLVAPMNVEDADEDFPPHFPTATAMLFTQKPNGCARSPTYSGLGSNLTELKRRQVTMGSTNSLSKSTSFTTSVKRDSLDSPPVTKPTVVASSNVNGNHSPSVSFHLGSHSPGTSPDTPDNVFLGHTSPVSEDSRFPRSKSMSLMGPTQNGSRIPRFDAAKTVKPETNFPRSDSENNLQKRILQKQVGTIGGVGSSSQDEDSLSGTESLDSEGKVKKEKKKLKLIPKFMRRTDAH
ncbi:stromal interaction molecule homolog isoform X2 [Ruditapes philippinarum]|uniref:stromal interaction molecule homolog isoform X2 n=1 Tax=Ruditapes philippinarum TaxID=129788 RepID=UPI00295C1033|nr:stromal interaction molecule homolog isoform X2 [Ruditapes philippinarum]